MLNDKNKKNPQSKTPSLPFSRAAASSTAAMMSSLRENPPSVSSLPTLNQEQKVTNNSLYRQQQLQQNHSPAKSQPTPFPIQMKPQPGSILPNENNNVFQFSTPAPAPRDRDLNDSSKAMGVPPTPSSTLKIQASATSNPEKPGEWHSFSILAPPTLAQLQKQAELLQLQGQLLSQQTSGSHSPSLSKSDPK